MIPCLSCNQGSLVAIRTPRATSVGVIIGYLLFIPALCGLPLGAVIMYAMITAAQKPELPTTFRYVNTQLQDDDIPPEISDRVLAEQPIPAADLQPLTSAQKRTVSNMQMRLLGARIGRGFGLGLFGGASVGMILTSFATMGFGCLLASKKNVLECSWCGAISAPASS